MCTALLFNMDRVAGSTLILYGFNAESVTDLMLRGRLLNQHHVAIEMLAQQAERLIVRGPVKIYDAIREELRDLVARRTVNRGNP